MQDQDIRETILIVEDDLHLNQLLKEELTDAGFQAHCVHSAEKGREWMANHTPDLILCDLKLPGEDGLGLLHETREHTPQPAFIIITAFGSVPQAVEALKAGADDFLIKPLDLDQLVICVQRTLENRRLREEVKRYRSMLKEEDFHGLIGHSRAMQSLFEQIRQVAVTGSPVLIIGESGSGKELVAQAVHGEGFSGKAPMVVLNCAGIPGELMESELFGHTAGAFTGAAKQRTGLFAEAHGGSLFLDEISEMPLPMQAKLLRVLQDGKIRPVGSNKEVETNVRIMAATNKDLEEEVNKGNFRKDLFYRMETFIVRVPPLREREDDISLLAAKFLYSFSAKLNRDVRGFSDTAMDLLRNYDFPGNVRELQNAVDRAVTFCRGRWITPEDLPERIRKGASQHAQAGKDKSVMPSDLLQDSTLPSLEELKERYIHYVLEHTQGNRRRAAALLGIGRRTLYRYLGE